MQRGRHEGRHRLARALFHGPSAASSGSAAARGRRTRSARSASSRASWCCGTRSPWTPRSIGSGPKSTRRGPRTRPEDAARLSPARTHPHQHARALRLHAARHRRPRRAQAAARPARRRTRRPVSGLCRFSAPLASVMGQVVKLSMPRRRFLLPFVIGSRGRHLMRSVRRRRDNLLSVIVGDGCPSSLQRSRPRQPCVPATGPRERPAETRIVSARLELVSYAATVAAPSSLPQRNSVPSTQMRCSTTLSLRASATRARRSPRRPGHLHRPALQRREARHPRQQHVRGLVERGAHAGIADLGDRADAVGLARLVTLRRQTEVGAEHLRPRVKRPGSSTPVR